MKCHLVVTLMWSRLSNDAGWSKVVFFQCFRCLGHYSSITKYYLVSRWLFVDPKNKMIMSDHEWPFYTCDDDHFADE